MNNEEILRYTALKEGISYEEFLADIQAAIDEAMKSTDPKIQERWKNIPSKTGKPTPEEVFAYFVKQLLGQ